MTFLSPRSHARRRAIVLAVLSVTTSLASGMAAPAFAQSAPPFRNLDDNGVDLTLGDLVVVFPEASVGSGDAELPLTRIISGGTLTSNWDNYGFKLVRSGLNVTVTISGPNRRSDTFTLPASGNVGTSLPNGATLSHDTISTYIYTKPDGSSVTFGNPDYDIVPAPANGLCAPNAPQTGCTLLPQAITDPEGHSVSLFLDNPSGGAARKLMSVSNSFGYSISFAYSGSSRTRADFRRGSTLIGSVSYSYPAAGAINITDMAGNIWRLTTTSITRPGETAPSFSVGGTPLAVTSVTRDGVTTTYNRAVNGNTGTMVVTDPAGNPTTIVSDLAIGRPKTVTDALSKTTTYSYDASARLTRITQPEGNYVNYTLDGRGNATETRLVKKAGPGPDDIVSTAVFPSTCTSAVSCNQPTSTTDPLLHTTNYGYDATTGLLTSVTAPSPTVGAKRPETRYSYTFGSAGLALTGISTCASGDTSSPTCIGTSAETRTTIGYDSFGNLTSVTRAAGDGSVSATTTATYTALGDVASVDGPLAGSEDTVSYRYDAARRQIGVISADPDGAGALKRQAVRTSYNAAGLVTQTELGTVNGTTDVDWAAFVSLQQSTPTYDANSRKTRDVVTAGGTTYGVTEYSYDAYGRPDCTATRMNTAAWGTPLAACTAAAVGSFGPDRLSKVTLYDALNRAREVTSAYGTPDASVEKTAYTDNGQTASVTDAENNLTSYTYDGFDRLSRTSYPNTGKSSGTSSTTDYEELLYDAAGNVTSRRLRGYATDSTRHIDYGYDALNRVTLKDLPGAESDVTYSYDLLGQLTGGSQSGNALSFTYDALGRNRTQVGPQGTVAAIYDPAGRRTQLTYPDGFYVTYTYQVTGEMTAIRENGTALLASFAYDDLGRRASLTRGNGVTTSYAYDGVSRLSSQLIDAAGSIDDLALSFAYNPASQIISTQRSNDSYAWTGSVNTDRGYAANGLNQYTTAGGVGFTYDARGNLTSSGGSSFGYGSENQLLTAPGAASLSYDPLLRLYQSTATSFATARFGYDGLNMIEERDGANGLQKRYIFGPGIDEALVEYDAGGNKTWPAADERGSVIARTGASGSVTAKNSYDEYGIPASGNAGRFQYTGQAWLPEIGMAYYKARIYSPTLGRFLQTDPIGYGDGLNWYNYAGGDPVNLFDPTGTDANGEHYCLTSMAAADDSNYGCTDPTPIFVIGRPGSGGLLPRGGGGGGGGRMSCPPGQVRNADSSGARCADKPTPQSKRCAAPSKSVAYQVADWASWISSRADEVAVVSGGLGLVTSPTVAGFAIFEGIAVIAGGVGRAASVINVGANLIDGNYEGAANGAVSFIGGSAAGFGAKGLLGRYMASGRTFRNLSAGQQKINNVAGDAVAGGYGRAFSQIGC